MTIILEGVYQQGKIELLQPPPDLREGRVRVILIADEPAKPPPCFLTYGKYPTGKMSTLEDFRDAEWHGEEEFNAPNGQ
jgi:hypothetical protein